MFNNSSSYQQFPPVASNASPFLSEQWNAQTLAGNFGVASPNTPYPPSHPFPQSQGHQAVSSGQPPTTHQHVPVRNVVVNSRKLSDMEVTDLQNTLRFPIVDGEYWYDSKCGAWGRMGSQCLGFIPPNLNIGGRLLPQASGGGTGVFINSRELHPLDVAAFSRVGIQCIPGRWSIDAAGNCGPEHGPVMFNVLHFIQANQMNQGTFRSSDGSVSGGVWSGGGSVSMKNSDGSYTSYGWG